MLEHNTYTSPEARAEVELTNIPDVTPVFSGIQTFCDGPNDELNAEKLVTFAAKHAEPRTDSERATINTPGRKDG